MNILFVSDKYHPYVGGVETQMRTIAHELVRKHEVEVAASLPDCPSYSDGPIKVHSLNLSKSDNRRMHLLRLLPKPYRSVRSRIGYQIYRAIYLPKLRPIIRGKDVVHALKTDHLTHIAEEAAHEAGVPFLVTPYFHPSDNARKARKQRIEAAFCNRADTVFALLETDREMLIHLGIERERVSLAGVMPLLPDNTDPLQFRAKHGLGDKPMVLFLGRIVETKGCKTILDAAPLVWEKMPEVRFVFAGPDRGAAEAWFGSDLDRRAQYLGLVDEQEKADALAACDLFCMPSTAEILPAVYLEAWSYGKAVVGGDAHGLYELIEGNGGGVTVKQDPQLLANTLLELLRDEPRRRQMGKRGCELVARRFSKTALVAALEGAYEKARDRSKQVD